MSEQSEQAVAWRQRHKLTQAKLAELSGYARETIYWMERGLTPQGRSGPKPGKIKKWVWQRYKMACAGVDAQIKSKKPFNW